MIRAFPIFPTLLAFLAAACGHSEEGLEQDSSASAEVPPPADEMVLWSSPDAPTGYRMEVDDQAVPADVVAGWVEPLWNDFWLDGEYQDESGAEVARAATAFDADAGTRFEGLVRAVMLLHEAQRRRPEIDPVDFAAFQRAFLTENGAMADALMRRMGKERLDAHIERRWWIYQLETDFAHDLGAPPEAQLLELYAVSLERAAQEGGEMEAAPGFEEVRRPLEALWRRQQRDVAIEAWVDARRAATAATVWLPDGTEVPVPAPAG